MLLRISCIYLNTHPLLLFISLAVLVSACEIKVNTGGDGKINSSKIRNDIQLKSKGVNVSQAFLLYELGELVPESNTAAVGQKVKLRLVIEKGWKEVNNKVVLGASERIETNDGKVFLNEEDLFGNMPEGVNKEDAQFITLSAVITGIDKLYDYFLVKFRVWDKNSDAEVSGSYKLYIK